MKEEMCISKEYGSFEKNGQVIGSEYCQKKRYQVLIALLRKLRGVWNVAIERKSV